MVLKKIFKVSKNGKELRKNKKGVLQKGSWVHRVYLGEVAGKKKYKQFRSKAAFQRWTDSEKRIKHLQIQHGSTVAQRDTALLASWAKYDDELRGLGSSLSSLAQEGIKRLSASKKQGSLGDAVKDFLRGKEGRLADRTYRDYEARLRRFLVGSEGLADLPARSLATEHIAQHLDSVQTVVARGCQYRVLSSFTAWGARESWWPQNLMPHFENPKTAKGEAVILSPSQAQSLLNTAFQSGDHHVLSFVAISLFGGLRPAEFLKRDSKGGFLRLDWADISIQGIKISKSLSKTGMGRVVPLLYPLPAWLEEVRKLSGGILSGPVLPLRGWETRWGRWKRKHWPHPWGHDQLRHSFCSYRLALTRNPPQTSMEAGHSVSVLLKNYWNYKTQEVDAEAFFRLLPPSKKKKLRVV
ncbi:MAG: tyrosine-type recombinase/integrase [Chthoniobacterales bacterium]